MASRTLVKNKWAGLSRVQYRIQNNLGIIDGGQDDARKMFRKPELDLFDAYYESRQYDDLIPWDEACERAGDDYTPIRKRQPRIIYNVTKLLVNKVTAKLIGNQVFPKFTIEDDPDDTEFFRMVQKITSFQKNVLQPVQDMLKVGSAFVRFYMVDGKMMMEGYQSKYCWPKFNAVGALDYVEIKYVYTDWDDRDSRGEPKQKWFRLELSTTSDILYDNPEYRPNSTPDFQVVSQADHGLGWVQGEWLHTGKTQHDPDGPALIADITDFIDELNYSLSQTSQAVGYNQDPQLGINSMDGDAIDELIKSSEKAWNLGREGKAEFIESDLGGVTVAGEQRDHFRTKMLEVVRVVIHDAEKIVGSAQSAKAMEVLYGPLVELVDELRVVIEDQLKNLLLKLGLTMLAMEAMGLETGIEIPAGYVPKSFDLTVAWPAIFPLTLTDIQMKANTANVLSMANIISRETLTKWLAADLGIENVEEELQKIASQPPPPNPFGDMGGGGGF